MLRHKVERVLCDNQECDVLENCSVKAIIGSVRLLRRLCFKNEFFVPFTPTKCILFIFPTSNPLNELDVKEETVNLVSTYLKWLRDTSKQEFNVLEFLVCTLSGCVVVTIGCADVLSALEVHSQSQDDAAPAIGNRCVLSFFCDKDDISSEKLETEYYIVPTCTICAERLEPTLTGYTSRTCRCSPHQECACFLEQSSCVVCQTLTKMQLEKHGIRCDNCNLFGDLWICLACGFSGCSRYQAQHAREHFLKQRHFFSMSLLTQQIWDYDGDAFVHRVVVTFDTTTGVVHRVQYPNRDNPPASLEEDVGDFVGEKTKKQHINAKYDYRVEMSNEKLALMIKERLDARRVEYENDQQYHHHHYYSQKEQEEREELNINAQSSCESDVYRTMSFKTKNDNRYRWLSFFLANKSIENELRQLAEEVEELEESQNKLDEELQEVVKHYAMQERDLIHQITEQEETIREIKMNLSLRQQLAEKLGNDECERVCVMGGGNVENKGSSSSKRKPRNKKK